MHAPISAAEGKDGFVVSGTRCDVSHEKHGRECEFRVAWSINPHMRIGTTRPAIAIWQHDTFVRQLARFGGTLQRVPFVHGAFDSVFAKDNAVLVRGRAGRQRALLASPRFHERRSEQGARRRSLTALGFDVEDMTGAHLEGGDVVVLPSGAFLGHGFRSEVAASAQLAAFLGGGVTPLKLIDQRLYHLDMALAVLEDGTAIACEDALSPDSRQRLRRSHAVSRLVTVPFSEALKFAVNVVQVGRNIVLGARAPKMEAALRKLGFDTHVAELDEFHRAGGSAACLVAKVHRIDVSCVASSNAA